MLGLLSVCCCDRLFEKMTNFFLPLFSATVFFSGVELVKGVLMNRRVHDAGCLFLGILSTLGSRFRYVSWLRV